MRNVVLLVFANKQDVDGGKFFKISLSEENEKLTVPFLQQCDQTT